MWRDPPAGPKPYGAAKARVSSGKHCVSLWLDPGSGAGVTSGGAALSVA